MKKCFQMLLSATLSALILFAGVPPVRAQTATQANDKDSTPDWQKEFDEVCSKTQEAMSLTAAELTELIGRCDRLQPRIEKADETRRKVYLKRLSQCRGLYAYVLESKNEKK